MKTPERGIEEIKTEQSKYWKYIETPLMFVMTGLLVGVIMSVGFLSHIILKSIYGC